MVKEKNKKTKGESLEEIKNLLLRTQANFENYRKQTEKRIDEIHEFAASNILLNLLPIIDNFELALKNANSDPENFKQGVELIYAQLNTLLENNDVKPIKTKDKMFDPYFHEALMKVHSDKPENTILEEFQRGFMLHNRVIRHAKVKISAGKKESDDNK